MYTVRIRHVYFPPDVLEKLWRKHQLEQWEVEEALEHSKTAARWEAHPVLVDESWRMAASRG